MSFYDIDGILLEDTDENPVISRNKNMDEYLYAATNNGNRFTMLLVADPHGDDNNMNAAVSYLNEHSDVINIGACLGDMAAGGYTSAYDWYINAVSQSVNPWLTVAGNHESGSNSRSIDRCGSAQQVYEKYMSPVYQYAGVTSDKNYYYKDFASQKIRIIVLWSTDVPDTLEDASTYVVDHLIVDCYSQAQIDWLITTLNSTPSDYQVVILTHATPAWIARNYNIPFTSDSDSAAGTGSTAKCHYPIIPDIVKAWIEGTTLTGSYEGVVSGAPTLSVSADFTARGTGVFIGYFVGHVHVDIVNKVATYNQNVAAFACCPKNRGNGLVYKPGTKQADCITIVSIDTSTKKIYLLRIGQQLTPKLNVIKAAEIDY